MKENKSATQMLSIPDENQRFMAVLEHYNYTGYKFSKEVKTVSETKVAHIRNGRNKPSMEMIKELLKKFPEVNESWLLTGKGEMLTNSEHNQSPEIHTPTVTVANKGIAIATPKDGARVPIPYYNVDFAGGWKSEEIFSLGNPDFYINNPEFERAEFACNLVGNSISRRIPNKAIIGLKLIQDWQTYFPTNELYAVVMKNELRTVKIVKRSKDKKNLLLVPDPMPEHNQTEYETEEVPMDFVSKFYQIIAWAQLERIAQ